MRPDEPVAVCLSCGHKHAAAAACADHQWTDSCPYVGVDVAVHRSHRPDAWHQYGLVPAGPGSAALAVEVTQRCRRCEMAVRIAGELTPVGALPCVGAPRPPRPT